MSTETLPTAADADAADPFRIGYRYLHSTGPDGRAVSVKVPLTEEDFLHPQEEDRFMITDLHWVTVAYLRHAIEVAFRGRPGRRVFADHRIDWQVAGILPHGPDVVAFADFLDEWDPTRGTLPVADFRARVLAVLEVTSPETRRVDFERKFLEFFDAGVPYYVIADAAGPEGAEKVLGFGRGADGFEPLPRDARLGVFVPTLGLWFRWDGERFVAATEDGRDVPTGVELADLAEAETQRADAERERADAETQRADAERERADALARELAELRARRNGTQ